MKKIVVVCANGKVGKLVVKEAIARGYDVTGFVRREDDKNFEGKKIVKDLFALTQNDLKSFDVVIDAFGVW